MTMKSAARFSGKALALVLAHLIAAQSATAAVQAVQVRTGALPVGAPAAVGSSALGASFSAPGGLSLQAASLQGLSVLPLSAVPTVAGSGVQAAAPVAGAPVSAAPGLAAPAASVPNKTVPISQAVQTLSEQRIQPAVQFAAEAMRGVERAPADSSKGAAETQFSVLTGEKRAGSSTFAEEPVAAAPVTLSASLKAPEAKAPAVSEVPAKTGFTQVFKDPERNKSFWRYVAGYVTFLFGFRMYVVGLPYYISGLAKNSMQEANDPRLADGEAVKALVRENRSLARIAHWVAQGISYATRFLRQSRRAGEQPAQRLSPGPQL